MTARLYVLLMDLDNGLILLWQEVHKLLQNVDVRINIRSQRLIKQVHRNHTMPVNANYQQVFQPQTLLENLLQSHMKHWQQMPFKWTWVKSCHDRKNPSRVRSQIGTLNKIQLLCYIQSLIQQTNMKTTQLPTQPLRMSPEHPQRQTQHLSPKFPRKTPSEEAINQGRNHETKQT